MLVAILDTNSLTNRRMVHIINCNYWILDGLTVTNGLQGIMLDNSSFNLINNVYAHSTGQKAVHYRKKWYFFSYRWFSSKYTYKHYTVKSR